MLHYLLGVRNSVSMVCAMLCDAVFYHRTWYDMRCTGAGIGRKSITKSTTRKMGIDWYRREVCSISQISRMTLKWSRNDVSVVEWPTERCSCSQVSRRKLRFCCFVKPIAIPTSDRNNSQFGTSIGMEIRIRQRARNSIVTDCKNSDGICWVDHTHMMVLGKVQLAKARQPEISVCGTYVFRGYNIGYCRINTMARVLSVVTLSQEWSCSMLHRELPNICCMRHGYSCTYAFVNYIYFAR